MSPNKSLYHTALFYGHQFLFKKNEWDSYLSQRNTGTGKSILKTHVSCIPLPEEEYFDILVNFESESLANVMHRVGRSWLGTV